MKSKDSGYPPNANCHAARSKLMSNRMQIPSLMWLSSRQMLPFMLPFYARPDRKTSAVQWMDNIDPLSYYIKLVKTDQPSVISRSGFLDSSFYRHFACWQRRRRGGIVLCLTSHHNTTIRIPYSISPYLPQLAFQQPKISV